VRRSWYTDDIADVHLLIDDNSKVTNTIGRLWWYQTVQEDHLQDEQSQIISVFDGFPRSRLQASIDDFSQPSPELSRVLRVGVVTDL